MRTEFDPSFQSSVCGEELVSLLIYCNRVTSCQYFPCRREDELSHEEDLDQKVL